MSKKESSKESSFGYYPFRDLEQRFFQGMKTRQLSPQDNSPALLDDNCDDGKISIFLRPARHYELTDNKSAKGRNFMSASKKNGSCGGAFNLLLRGVKKTQCATGHVAASKTDDADANLFFDAMRQVAPLSGRGRDISPAPLPRSMQLGETAEEKFLQGEYEFSLYMAKDFFEGHVLGIDSRTLDKLRSGVFSPEAHLDMHGLNAEQAYDALRVFLRSCWYKGLRTVLVIPGKGNNSVNGVGVLRGKLPSWLMQEPFKRVVLAFCTAQPFDGGTGGVYVLLRKDRSKQGKIYWEYPYVDVN